MEVYGIPLALAASDVFILSAWQIEFLFLLCWHLYAFLLEVAIVENTTSR